MADAGDYGLNKGTDYEASGTFYRLTAAKLQALLDTDIAGLTTAAKTEYVGPQRYSATDDNGHTTIFKYDEQGRVVRTGYPAADYVDAAGNPANGPLYVHVGYDGLGRKVWESEMTPQADVAALTNDEKRWFEYDPAGRLTKVTLPRPHAGDANPVYRYIYDDNGNQVGILDPLARLTVFTFDHMGRQTVKYMPFVVNSATITDAASVYNALPANQLCAGSEYDSLGRLKLEMDYKQQAIGYFYDDFGRLQYKCYYPADATPETPGNDNYDENNPETGWNERVEYQYDNLGRVEQETWTDGTDTRTTTYAYDAEGQMVRMAVPDGVINYAYNPITGQKTLAESLDVNETTIFAETEYGYDGLGRLSEVRDVAPEGDLTHTYTYNAVGSRRQMVLANNASPWYEYNAMNQLTRVAHHVEPYSGTGTEPATLNNFAYSHYADGMRAKVAETMAESRTITYTYDNLNRLAQERAALSGTPPTAGYQADYTYDLAGNRTQRVVTANNGTLTTAYAYDPATDRLMTETNVGPLAQLDRGDRPVFAYADGNGGIFYQSGDGERVGSLKAFWMGLPSKLNRYLIWSMCGMLVLALLLPLLMKLLAQLRRSPIPVVLPYRLSTRCIAMVLAFLMVLGPWEFQQLAQADTAYANISTLDWAKGGTTVSYTYDDNGSVLTKTTSGSESEVVTYDYNLQGRLARIVTDSDPSVGDNVVEVTDYTYNDSGIRVQAYRFQVAQDILGTGSEQTSAANKQTTLYLIDSDNPTGYAQAVAELVYNEADPDPATAPASVRSYTIGDDMIAQTDEVGDPEATQYLLYDGHGSTRQVINGAQVEVPNGSFSYDAYGMMLGGNPTTPAATNLLYTGEHYDTAASSYYLRARWYDPSNGRFNRMDPYAGNNNDPQSLHKYLYCHANPVNGIDPSGLSFTFTGMLITAGISGLISSILVGSYGYAKGWSAKKIAKAAGYAFLTGAVAGALAYGAAAAFAAAAVGAGVSAGQATALGWTTVGLIGGPTGVGLAIGNVDDAFKKGDSTDQTFAVVNLGLASFGFIASHWSAFNLAATATAAKIPQVTQNHIVGEAAEREFIANAQANGFTVAGRRVSVNTPFGRRVIDVVLKDPQNPVLNYGVEIKSSINAMNRFDAAARQQFAADRWINEYGAVGIGQYHDLQITGTCKILWWPK